MHKKDIQVGKRYRLKMKGTIHLTTVRVDQVVESPGYKSKFFNARARTVYQCTNLSTGRGITVKSAMRFRSEVTDAPVTDSNPKGE